jgi:hypothetical protein
LIDQPSEMNDDDCKNFVLFCNHSREIRNILDLDFTTSKIKSLELKVGSLGALKNNLELQSNLELAKIEDQLKIEEQKSMENLLKIKLLEERIDEKEQLSEKLTLETNNLETHMETCKNDQEVIISSKLQKLEQELGEKHDLETRLVNLELKGATTDLICMKEELRVQKLQTSIIDIDRNQMKHKLHEFHNLHQENLQALVSQHDKTTEDQKIIEALENRLKESIEKNTKTEQVLEKFKLDFQNFKVTQTKHYESFSDDKKTTLEKINQLEKKLIEIEGEKQILAKSNSQNEIVIERLRESTKDVQVEVAVFRERVSILEEKLLEERQERGRLDLLTKSQDVDSRAAAMENERLKAQVEIYKENFSFSRDGIQTSIQKLAQPFESQQVQNAALKKMEIENARLMTQIEVYKSNQGVGPDASVIAAENALSPAKTIAKPKKTVVDPSMKSKKVVDVPKVNEKTGKVYILF